MEKEYCTLNENKIGLLTSLNGEGSLKKNSNKSNCFSANNQEDYCNFSLEIANVISNINSDVKFIKDVDKVINTLSVVLTNNRIGETIYENDKLINCFIDGSYNCSDDIKIKINVVENFYNLLSEVNYDNKLVLLDNLENILREKIYN